MGYHRAGFDVVGVDLRPQPGYPFPLIEDDALDYLAAHGDRYDAIHASPPCQPYSAKVHTRSSRWVPGQGRDEPALIAATRTLLQEIGKPWVLESVIGAEREMSASLLLCGVMFDLPVRRHRLFETSSLIFAPDHPYCTNIGRRFAEERGWDPRDMSVTGKGRRSGTLERWKEIMGIDWEISQRQIVESIPPAYTEWIGRQLMNLLGRSPTGPT